MLLCKLPQRIKTSATNQNKRNDAQAESASHDAAVRVIAMNGIKLNNALNELRATRAQVRKLDHLVAELEHL